MPCDPGCEGYGEMAVCRPGHPRILYLARSDTPCQSGQQADMGNWLLSLDAVAPLPESGTFVNFVTHGHLSAVLVNASTPWEIVAVELDF
jgi:hypothetical protein